MALGMSSWQQRDARDTVNEECWGFVKSLKEECNLFKFKIKMHFIHPSQSWFSIKKKKLNILNKIIKMGRASSHDKCII